MKRLLLAALLLLACSPAYAAIFGPLFSGSSQTPTTGNTPVVASNACTIALPVTNGVNVTLAAGGGCMYTATCNSGPCTGDDTITSWAITAQSTANSFSITSGTGILQGGSAAGSVTTGSYTVTVTATNLTGTSTPVVQTVSVFQPPIVAALSCSIKSPITNNTNVVLQAGGSCQYTATCGGGACSGGNAISGWSVTADTCTSCYQVTSSGVLQGSTGAATVTNRTDTVTVIATNAGGNSPPVAQTVTAITVPVITNKNCSMTLPITNGLSVCNMVASPAPSSWAITAVSGDGGTTSDFAISSGGAITTAQASPPGAITSTGTISISLTATNATGTSSTGTATVTVNSGAGDPYSSVDGSPNAPGDTGNALYTIFLNPSSIATPQANKLATYHAGGHSDARVYGTLGPPNYGPGDPNYFQAPWFVPGIDYPVGVRPAFLPLKTTILTDANHGPLACTSISGSSGGHSLNINSSNCTLQGYDMSVDSGVTIAVGAGLTNVLISDIYYKRTGGVTSDALDCNNSAVTVQYSVFDQNAVDSSNNVVAKDCWKFNYVWMLNAHQDSFNYGVSQPGTTASTQGTFVNFSVVQDTGCKGGHSDIWQGGTPPAGGAAWNVNFTFDFIWQKGASSSLCTGTEGTQGIFISGFTSPNTPPGPPVTGSILNTTYITQAITGGGTELNGFAQWVNNSSFGDGHIVSPGINYQFNYADPTSTNGNWVQGSGSSIPTPSTLLVIQHNMNMLNGLSDAAAGWNHNP